jgi:hypothetical protein
MCAARKRSADSSARPQRTPVPSEFRTRKRRSTTTTILTAPRPKLRQRTTPLSYAPPLASGLPTHLEDLADRAREHVEAASAPNTRRAYDGDWKHFCSWCRRQGLEHLPPDPQFVGLYITACASGAVMANRKPAAVSSIERRLSALSWHYRQLGERLNRGIATVLDGIRNTHGRLPVQKEAVLPEDLVAMLETP